MRNYMFIVLLLVFSNTSFGKIEMVNDENKSIELIIKEFVEEYESILLNHKKERKRLLNNLIQTNIQLRSSLDTKKKLDLLIQRDLIKEKISKNNLSELSNISKIRYLKGLEIIKILNEKILALDHHFSTVTTFNEINKISNPNHYNQFINIKDDIIDKAERKKGFDLPSLLGDNIYTTVIHSLVMLFTNSSISKKEKESSLDEVKCILDFTLRMHNDLNTIYFETSFLQKSNDNVKKDLERLFIDFTAPIKYNTALKECRNNDDWHNVRNHLDDYLDVLNSAITDPSQKYKAHKMQINLEFPIDRLLQFITSYNSFIDQGAKFYEKFGIMLDSYENEKQCANEIPMEYKKLKESIAISIEKFTRAYKPVEINGSKMKEILYGINEYE